ncbi:MAG: zf-HC2 domain-containing protein [Armatimonadetes bacterium]|nr:zf-HC2 domain-containing protein [Armatimonadota bacterium]
MLRCRDIVDLLAQYLDRELDADTARALDHHLADCRPCTAFVSTYRSTVRTTRRLREEELPSQLRERLATFLRRQARG